MTVAHAAVLVAAGIATILMLITAGWFGRRLDRVERDLAGAPVALRARLGWILAFATSVAAGSFGLAGAGLGAGAAHYADLRQGALLAALVYTTVAAELGAVLFLTGGQASRLGMKVPDLRWALLGACGAPVILGLSAAWEILLTAVGHPPQPQDVISVLSTLSPALQAAGALAIGVVSPFLEEVLFRGVWFARLEPQIGAPRTILLTGLCFGLLHLSSPWAVPILAAMGLTLGWLRARSGSIWPGVILHGLNNTIAIVLVLVLGA